MKEKLINLINTQSNVYARYLEKSHKDLFLWVNNYPGSSIPEKCYNAINEIQIQKIFNCKSCNNEIKKPFLGVKRGYRLYCSNKCSAKENVKKRGTCFNNPDFIEKRKNTLVKKYGTNSMISINREKSKKTNQEKYGVDFPLQSKLIRDKVKENLFNKHGVNNQFQIQKTIEKIKDTNQLKYGVDHPLQSSIFKNKMQSSMLDRYGVTSALKSPIIIEKLKQTNIEKYGCINVMQNPIISSFSGYKQKKNSIDNDTYNERIDKFKKLYLVEPQFTEDDFLNGKQLLWKHICGTIYESTWRNGCLNVCPNNECRKQSTPQRLIYEFILDIFPNEIIKINDRSIIKPLELDIYLPNLKFAIEVDGVYWHQNESYKISKKDLCKANGISLLHITDISWFSKSDIWKQTIFSKLGFNKIVYANKCEIRQVSNLDSEIFLNKNHLDGFINSKINLGLYLNNELVSLMTFDYSKNNKKYKWEILRFCNKLDLSVVGGASKLLKCFRRNNSGSIITYAKKEYATGNLYDILKFKRIDDINSNHFYVKRNEKVSTEHFNKLYETFDNSLTEKENMKKAGYILVQDRGYYTYILE